MKKKILTRKKIFPIEVAIVFNEVNAGISSEGGLTGMKTGLEQVLTSLKSTTVVLEELKISCKLKSREAPLMEGIFIRFF